MNAARPLLRLVRDDDPIPDPPIASELDAVAQIQALRNEVHVLTAELQNLRGQSETLGYHMSRLDEELKLAARLQQDFLPKSLPQLGRVHFHTLFRPAGHVSGDFYDVMRLDEKNIGFYIADAVGHGVPAALLTMFIKHALATKQITHGTYRLLTAAETMTRLNKTLIEQELSAATFATALYGTINIETLKLTLSRAGHPYPALLRPDGTVLNLEPQGGLLGVFPDEQFEQQEFQLQSGDRLVMFTDGVEVCFDDNGHADAVRWKRELESRRLLSGQQLIEEMGALVDRQFFGRRRKDDLTMLVVEIR